jgi:CRISPR locus-related DNA-binding protein
MAKVLIASLYSPEPVLLAATRLGPDKLVLIIDERPLFEEAKKTQEKNLKLIQESLGKVIEIKVVKSPAYDIVKTAAKTVEIIDSEHKDNEIFVNVTSGRKTLAMGLLFGAYARADLVSKIAYNPEEDKKAVVWLPKLMFKLTESQKIILEAIDRGNFKTPLDLASKVKLSRAMLYRSINELKDMGYIEVDGKIELTDAGKIARL